MKQRYKLEITYDGTNYAGWQIQPNGLSIQQAIEKALFSITRKSCRVTGSGRTDAGVHALGQVAHFDATDFDSYKALASLNSLLPKDIRIASLKPISSDFHARFSATGKVYHYHLHLNKIIDPFSRLYKYHYPKKLDVDLMKAAAKEFLGIHDFTSFANVHGGSKNHVKTLRRLDLLDQEGGLRFELEADGFLYKMVRNIVGTLIEIGKGTLKIPDIGKILLAKDRTHAGKAAPGHGLFLMEVTYPKAFSSIASKEGK